MSSNSPGRLPNAKNPPSSTSERGNADRHIGHGGQQTTRPPNPKLWLLEGSNYDRGFCFGIGSASHPGRLPPTGLAGTGVDVVEDGLQLGTRDQRRGARRRRCVGDLPRLTAIRFERLVARLDHHHLRLSGQRVVDDLAVRAQPLPVARAGADGSRRGVCAGDDIGSDRICAVVVDSGRLGSRWRACRIGASDAGGACTADEHKRSGSDC